MISARWLTGAVLLGIVLAGSLAAFSQEKPRGRGGSSATAAPPKTWKEHWFEHNQTVRLVTYDSDVAVYFDDGVPKEGTEWIAPFMQRAWRYTKKTYGGFGSPKDRLFAIFHEGRYSGGHPSTFFDESHEYRNVTDCGPGPWPESAVDLPSHELGHIVEGASQGVHESPAFDLWHDSKWIELYQFDLYTGLGMQADAERVFAKFTAQADDFPRANTHWFRDFFYPAWRDHGRSKLMAGFFRLLAVHFPKTDEANGRQRYARKLNWGEFIHFMSAAAHRDLRPLAKRAFGWPKDWEREFQQARTDFAELTYKP